MKQFKFLPDAVLVTVIACSLFSCGSGEEKKAEETTTDTSAVVSEAPVTPSGPVSVNMMVIRHKVSNFAKWKPHYESHDSIRAVYGLHKYVIARGTDDSNMVLVAMRMDDVNKAKEMGASKELKERMKKGGVIGAPLIDYTETEMYDTSAMPETARLLVTHKIKDWDAWKKTFDSHKQERADAGLTDRLVGRSVGDNKNVSVVFSVSDIGKAKEFIRSKELKDRMAEAGVNGKSTFFFYKVVQRY